MELKKWHFNPLTPNDPCSGRTTPLTSKRCILYIYSTNIGRVKTGCDGTRAETRFGRPAKRTSLFISAGMSVQLSTGFLGVRVGGERL